MNRRNWIIVVAIVAIILGVVIWRTNFIRPQMTTLDSLIREHSNPLLMCDAVYVQSVNTESILDPTEITFVHPREYEPDRPLKKGDYLIFSDEPFLVAYWEMIKNGKFADLEEVSFALGHSTSIVVAEWNGDDDKLTNRKERASLFVFSSSADNVEVTE